MKYLMIFSVSIKMHSISLLLVLAAVSAVPHDPHKIVGGSYTSISQYPQTTALLYSATLTDFSQRCGGVIINQRSILSARQCFERSVDINWRIRVGSTYSIGGGIVHSVQVIIRHPQFNSGALLNYDIAILRTLSSITYVNNAVQPASFAGSTYNLDDDEELWIPGWGRISDNGPYSEQIQHVQVYSINQSICASRYRGTLFGITNIMLCSGILDVGGRDHCIGDTGGPVLHENVVVGIASFGIGCASQRYPGVSARVSEVIDWVVINA